jgi:hypothetical protein
MIKQSKLKDGVVKAYNDGFRIINNKLTNKQGITRKTSIHYKGLQKNLPYYFFSYGSFRIYFHHLAAFQKFQNSWLLSNLMVRHKNNDSSDNSFENILLGTNKENQLDVPEKQRKLNVVKAHKITRKFTDETIREIREKGKIYSSNSLCKIYNCDVKTMWKIITRKTYQDII